MGDFLYRWFMGFVVLHMQGKYVERLINACIKAGLEIWNIRRMQNEQFQLCVALKDFFRLRPILKETGTRMKIAGKAGFPFLLYRLNRRKGLVVGFFLFVVTLYMLSSMIWKVEVYGLKSIPKEEVLRAAEEVGVKRWALKWRLNPLEELQYELGKKLKDAAWVGIRMDGVVAKIQVVEKIVPDKKELLTPRHLVASKKAVIEDIFVDEGLAKVEPRQFVQKGQILISGIIGPDGDPSKQRVVAAKGQVWGEVFYEAVISVPLKREIPNFTGNSATSYYLIVGNYAVKVWGPGEKSGFEKAKVDEERQFLYFRDKMLPIGWKREKQYEYQSVTRTLSKEEAVAEALEAGRKDLLLKAGEGSRIKTEKVLQQWEENGKVYIKVLYAVIEQIAEEQPIIGAPIEQDRNETRKRQGE